MSQVYTNTFDSIFVDQIVSNTFGQPINIPSNMNNSGLTTLNNVTIGGTLTIGSLTTPTLTVDNLNVNVQENLNGVIMDKEVFHTQDCFTTDKPMISKGNLICVHSADNTHGFCAGPTDAKFVAMVNIEAPSLFQVISQGYGPGTLLSIDKGSGAVEVPGQFIADVGVQTNSVLPIAPALIVDFPNGASVSELIVDPLSANISVTSATALGQDVFNVSNSIKSASTNISVLNANPLSDPLAFNLGASSADYIRMELNKATGTVAIKSVGPNATLQEWVRASNQVNLYGELHTPSGDLIIQNSAAQRFNVSKILPYIGLYRVGNGSATTITTAATYTKGVCGYSTSSGNSFSVNASLNGAVYVGVEQKRVKIDYSIWLAPTAGIGGVFNCAIALNPTYNVNNELTSTVINGSVCQNYISAGARYATFSGHLFVTMNQNDSFEVVITNESGTDSIEIRGGSISAQAFSNGND